jgi:hypothetical protein
MTRSARKKQLSPRALEELKTQVFRVQPLASAERMWEQLFTPSDRKKWGGEFLPAWKKYRTAGMWAKTRGTSIERAVLDVAVGIGHMSHANYEWLLREMGMRRTPRTTEQSRNMPPVPEWNAENGELRFRGKLVRTLRVGGRPTNIQRIVDAFQEEGWPTSIDNPLPGGPNQQRLHATLQSLNEGLKGIRFHGQRGGRAIRWARA